MMKRVVGWMMLAGALFLPPVPARGAAPTPAAKPSGVRVAVYDDTGASVAKRDLAGALAGYPGLRVEWVKAADVRDGALGRFDVVLFPGGLSGTQAKALGEKGRECVREFVKGGGGYVGI